MNKKLLAIFAHPDDETFGPGGTLAKYAAEGVEVHVAIATDGGAGSVVDDYKKTKKDLVKIRSLELKEACKVLGAKLHTLNYKDSGYKGDLSAKHKDAFINKDKTEVVERIVKLIREIRPQVVMTHGPTGEYFHPDHIRCCEVVTEAFKKISGASDGEVLQPSKLYYYAIPKRFVKMYCLLLRFRGNDPKCYGRNKDIDLTKAGSDSNEINKEVDYKKYYQTKESARRKHVSQGGLKNSHGLPTYILKNLLAHDHFIEAIPGNRNNNTKDLFGGI